MSSADCTRSYFSQVVLRRRGGDRIYEMRCLFVAVRPNARFIVLPHWDNMSQAHMLTHPVTSYWHRADQLCFVAPTSLWLPCKKRPLSFLTSLVWLDPAATRNRTHRTTWSVLGPLYCRLLRSAGATEEKDKWRSKQWKATCRMPWAGQGSNGIISL